MVCGTGGGGFEVVDTKDVTTRGITFDFCGFCSVSSLDKIQNRGKSAPFKGISGGNTFTSTFRAPFYGIDGTQSFQFLSHALSNPPLSTFSMFLVSKVLTRRLG